MFIHNYVNTYEPVYKLTKILQNKNVSLSEFYFQWVKATYDIEKIDSPFAEPLSQALYERLKKLMQNNAFKAAVYMDPKLPWIERFN